MTTFQKILAMLGYSLIVIGLILAILITKKQHTVTTISSYPQTFTMECEDCEGVTDSIIMREALMYDNTQFIDSVPPKYELDVAYYEKIPSSPFWRVVVFNKVKIDD